MPWPQNRRVIGTKVPRLDGPEKATGRAKYSYDINRPGMLHAKILRSPHAHARIRTIETAAAEKTPGFRAFHLLVKPGAELTWAGQEILAICADTEEHCEDCLRAVRVEYDILPHMVKEADALQGKPGTMANNGANIGKPAQTTTANFDKQAWENATVAEGTYGIAVISHQCLESHGLVAEWDQNLQNLTVWISTQAVPNQAGALAQNFNIPATNVKSVCHYMGGGFGSKFNPGPEGMSCCELARKTRAPVKLMLDRAEEVLVGGMRPSTYGKVKIAADRKGKLQAYESESHASAGVGNAANVIAPYVYTHIPHRKSANRVVRLNYQTQRAMRAPGHPQSCFLTDQAIDDLCARLNVNPLQFRLDNLPPNDPKAPPTTLPALRHTIYSREIEIARKMSGWDKKWHAPGRGEGVVRTGIGMGIHTWGGGGRGPNPTRVTISPDGSVLVQAGTQDLGTSQRTVEAIIVAEVLGLQTRDITVQVGESQFGASTPSGGSTTCPGTSPAILKAAENARDALLAALAQRLNVQASDLAIEPGVVVNRRNNERLQWRQACARLGQNPIQATGDWPTQAQMNADPKLRDEWTQHLTNHGVGGVQIAEVKVDTETGVVKCTNIWAVQDVGLIISMQGCESQMAGGVIMGVNYALFEECIYDRTTGRQVNPDMEFYKLGGIEDMPQIHIHMMNMPERGVIGIGEPATISTAAAIGNAIFNAIGVRVPNAPYTPDRVLAALASRKGGNS